MSDRLDLKRDAIIDLAMEGTVEPMEAVSTCLTAGFSILIATVGQRPACAMLQGIVDQITAETAH